MAWKRLPNNYGTVYKLSGNRRRPFIARKRVGESYDDELKVAKPIYVTIGYFETKKEALSALANTPENITKKEEPTFGEVLDLWLADKYSDREPPSSYDSAFNHVRTLRRRRMSSIRAADIEAFINDDGMPRSVKHFVKTILNQVFSYAVRHDIIDKNYAHLAQPKIDTSVHTEKRVFKADEVKKVWNMAESEKRDMMLILLYSGIRINECLKLTVEDFHDSYFITGSKTEAGKNRVVPVHPDIRQVVEHRLSQTGGKLFHYSMKTAQQWIKDHTGHTAHECRHTFATQAMECGMHEEARKRILGHASQGVTNKTYTHLDIEFLSREMKKLRY